MNKRASNRNAEKTLWEIVKPQFISVLKYAAMFLIALIYWEFLLRTQTGFEEMSFYFLLFLPAEAMFLAFLNGWLKRKWNRIATPVVMLLPFAFYVAQLVYYRIFGSMFSISMIGMGADAVENFGWALWDTIGDSVGWIFLCLLPVLAVAAFAYFAPKKYFKRYSPAMHFVTLLKTVLLWSLAVLMLIPFGTGDASPYAAYSSSNIDTDTASSRLGVLTNSVLEVYYSIFGSDAPSEDLGLTTPVPPEPLKPDTSPNTVTALNFNKLSSLTSDKGKQELCNYFAQVGGTNKNEYTGKLKDFNVIYICAESFCSYAIDPVVTPILYKMSQGGIVLNNYYNSFKNTTTNGEFAFMTGLWPDVSRDADTNSKSGSFTQSKDNYIPFALGNMFEKDNVKTYAYHNFRGYYYSRNETHPNLGYTTTRFMNGENGMRFTTSWPSSDLEMMEQSVDDYINNPRFHAYYMTFSGHGPYSDANPIAVRNLKTVKALLAGRSLPNNAVYYLAANYELEKAMDYLIKRLETAGKLNSTLIVLTGDHYPYYLNSNSLDALAGRDVGSNFEQYKSTCIMYAPGISTVKVDTPCCNVDILPTVLNLLGMEYDSRLLPGTDIFSSNDHYAMLYNKSFVTDKVKYNATNGKAEWQGSADLMSESDKQAYIDYYSSLSANRYNVSLKLMKEDFFRFAFDNIQQPVTDTSSLNSTGQPVN
ncbi:MAG: sulfatase-like hydrolase/transferase [Clostridia bacterium]|nr:sulfatase-like hydrolase/transferase [Clostridia bacterium]